METPQRMWPKCLTRRTIFHFSSNCQALKLKLTLRCILGNGTKAHKAFILEKWMAGLFSLPDKRKEKGRAQSKTKCQVLFLSCLFRCDTDRKILGGQDGRKRYQKMNNSHCKPWQSWGKTSPILREFAIFQVCLNLHICNSWPGAKLWCKRILALGPY